MSDEYDLGTSSLFKRQMEIAGLMLRGAAFGGAIFFGSLIFVWIFVAIGNLLPEESKQADDPTPWSYLAPAPDADRAA
jgi:hypothetical protein